MTVLHVNNKSHQWQYLLSKAKYKSLLPLLEERPMVEVAEFLQEQDITVCAEVMSLFDLPKQATLFSNLSEIYQLKIYNKLTPKVSAGIFEHMASDLRADFYQKLTDKQQAHLLPYLSKKIRKDIITLSAYSKEVAGGIMTTDFAVVYDNMNVEQALDKIRKDAPSKKMLYYLYVVDRDMKMLGVVDLKELIIFDPKKPIKAIIQNKFVFAKVLEDRELVAQKIEKYDLVAIPVLNDADKLVGLVTYDDAMEVFRAENTEDMEKLMGIVSDQETVDPYLVTSSFKHYRTRVGWIMGLFVASFLSGYLIHANEYFLHTIPFLTGFIPMLTDIGGNTGSQTTTVVITRMKVGEISPKDFLFIILKEAKIGFMFAGTFFILSYLKVSILSGSISFDKLAFVVSIAVALQTFTSTLVGATFPIFVRWIGKDPTMVASPAITTLVDLSGICIYVNIAKFFFG